VEFFVYVVESPSHEDFFLGRSEGQLVGRAAELNGVPHAIRSVTSEEMLRRALITGLYAEMLKQPDRWAILHLSAHGHEGGIGLTDGTFLAWDSLRDYLKPINTALGGRLLLCMSSCSGGSAMRMSMYPGDEEFPYAFMVGNGGTPRWSETAIAYATFYHHLAAGRPIDAAVNAMKVASGNDEFVWTSAKEAHDGYVEFLKNEEQKRGAMAALANLVQEQGDAKPEDVKQTVASRGA